MGKKTTGYDGYFKNFNIKTITSLRKIRSDVFFTQPLLQTSKNSNPNKHHHHYANYHHCLHCRRRLLPPSPPYHRRCHHLPPPLFRLLPPTKLTIIDFQPTKSKPSTNLNSSMRILDLEVF